jgi:hypothetical protein
MKYLIACAFTISTAFAVPVMTVSSASGLETCGPGTPASQLRPGGYCDNANSGKSLVVPVDEGCTSYETIRNLGFAVMKNGERVRVAVVCECPVYGDVRFVPPLPGDRIHLAQLIPEQCQE